MKEIALQQQLRRVAVVTGASRGIGRAIAERLAREGLSVVVNFQSDQAAADETVSAIEAAGGQAAAFRADVSAAEEVSALFAFANASFGGVDVTVNCAGTMVVKPLADYDLNDFDRMAAVNIRGTFLVSQQAARHVRAGGAIINMSTAAERQAMPGYGPYAMTKGAVEGLTLILAREMRGRDVTVNTIAPGPTATDLFLRGKDDALVETIASFNPFERIAEPSEIADVAAFLAGPARWINGQTIFVNGGMN